MLQFTQKTFFAAILAVVFVIIFAPRCEAQKAQKKSPPIAGKWVLHHEVEGREVRETLEIKETPEGQLAGRWEGEPSFRGLHSAGLFIVIVEAPDKIRLVLKKWILDQNGSVVKDTIGAGNFDFSPGFKKATGKWETPENGEGTWRIEKIK